jgi:hypothetical protein
MFGLYCSEFSAVLNHEPSEESLRGILEKFDDSIDMDVFVNYPCNNQIEAISQLADNVQCSIQSNSNFFHKNLLDSDTLNEYMSNTGINSLKTKSDIRVSAEKNEG